MAGKIKTRTSSKHTKRNKSKESLLGHKRANAAGFQKRIKGNQPKNMDVYDFNDDVTGKHRRSYVSTDLTSEEKRELGGDQDDLEPDEIGRVRRQLQSGEDGVVLSEDDEDIDSDEAFDATDEETFGAFKLKVRGAGWYRLTTLYSCRL
jgi:U3 small nucleolar RNA-associated protein 14